MKQSGVITLVIVILTIGYAIGFATGHNVAGSKFTHKLREAKFAPTPIVIGDSTYIIRYYSDFTCKNY